MGIETQGVFASDVEIVKPLAKGQGQKGHGATMGH